MSNLVFEVDTQDRVYEIYLGEIDDEAYACFLAEVTARNRKGPLTLVDVNGIHYSFGEDLLKSSVICWHEEADDEGNI